MRRWSITAVVVAAACAETSSGVMGDAGRNDVVDAADAADAASGPCRWRAGAALDLPRQGAGVRCALADLAAGAPGAWVARVCDRLAGDPDARAPLVIDRVDARGAAASTTRAAEGADDRAWVAVDDALGRRAALLRNAAGADETVVTLGPDGAPTGARSVTGDPMHFSLGGHQDLAVHRAGFSTVAQQIRALWGVSMLRLDAEGRSVSAIDLMFSPAFTPRIKRLALADRGFFMAWAEPGGAAAPPALRVRRYGEDGAPVAAAQVLDARYPRQGDEAPLRVALAPAAGGDALVVWEAEADTLPPLRTVAARRVGPDGAPRAAATLLTSLGFYAGGVDAAGSGGDVLVTAVTGSGVLRVVVAVLGPGGEPRGELIPVAMVAPTAPERVAARVVATAGGALVAFQRDASTVAVAPLTCAR
jgi:hypothetical protein